MPNEAADVIVVGAGNAAFCAALAAQEQGAKVLMLEAAPQEESGGNSRFTAGSIRVAYDGVEDMTTDGRSKVNFCNALRGAGAVVEHCFVFFFYDIFPEGKKILSDLGVTLHALATWWDVLEVAKKSGKFDKAKLKEVEKFMKDPAAWSKAHGGVAQAAE